MVEKILNNTTPYGKIRASHEGSLHSSTLRYRGFQQFAPKIFFEFVHIFCSGFGPSCDVTKGHE